MLNGSGEELLKSTSIVHVFIAETIMNLQNSRLITSSLKQMVEKALQAISYQLAENAIKGKVAVIGSDGCVRHLDVTL
jgi:hypothetical protein